LRTDGIQKLGTCFARFDALGPSSTVAVGSVDDVAIGVVSGSSSLLGAARFCPPGVAPPFCKTISHRLAR
jgi:hypothetical protein